MKTLIAETLPVVANNLGAEIIQLHNSSERRDFTEATLSGSILSIGAAIVMFCLFALVSYVIHPQALNAIF